MFIRSTEYHNHKVCLLNLCGLFSSVWMQMLDYAEGSEDVV